MLAAAGTTVLLAGCGGGDADPATSSALGTSRAQAVATSLPPAPPGTGGNVTCTNFAIGAIAVDSVIVPANAACCLDGTRLNGSLIVGQAATVAAYGIEARGSVQAEGAAHVALGGNSCIGGAVQIKQGTSAEISDNMISGDIQVDAMRGAVLVAGNQVGGNIEIVGTTGGATVSGNSAKGNLNCKENLPTPMASGNVAALLEGQCAGGGGGGGGPPPLSGNVTCVGLAVGAVPVDSVIVPANASCTLRGTRLNGTLQVGANASVTATDVQVTGSVQAEGAASLLIGGTSLVGGSVQLKQGGTATISGATVSGDLQIDAMRGAVAAAGNRIGGSLQAMPTAAA